MPSMLENEMKQLDQDFKNAITAIKPYILQLHDKNQIFLCRLWIEKLIKCAVEDKQLRNIYMDQLYNNLKAQRFGPPFCDMPWEGPLSKIPTQILLTNSYSDSEFWTTDNDGNSKFSDKSSERLATSEEDQCSDTSRSCTFNQTNDRKHCNKKKRMLSKPRGTKSKSFTSIKVFNSKQTHKSNKHKFSRLNSDPSRTITSIKNDLHRKKNVKLNKFCCHLSKNSSFTSLRRVPPKKRGFKLNSHSDSSTSLSTVLDSTSSYKHGVISLKNGVYSNENLKLCGSKNCQPECDDSSMFFSDRDVVDNSLNRKCSKLLKEIKQLKVSNDSLKTNLNREKNQLENICTEKIELQQEIVRTNENLSRLKELEKGARGKREAFVLEINEQLTFQTRRVRQALENNGRLERELKEILENSVKNVDGKFLKLLESEWKEKFRKLEVKKQETIRRADWDRRSATDDLENQLDASRQRLIETRDRRAKLENKFQQHFHSLRGQIKQIRDDHSTWKNTFDQRVNTKVVHYKSLIESLKKERCRIVKQYEIRLERMQQTKSMELWVKKFDNYLSAKSDEKFQLEKCLEDLEQDFHKQYTDVIDQA